MEHEVVETRKERVPIKLIRSFAGRRVRKGFRKISGKPKTAPLKKNRPLKGRRGIRSGGRKR